MIKIYNGKEDPDVFLRLKNAGSGEVYLDAVNTSGTYTEHLLIIHSNGTFSRCRKATMPGIQTDSEGRIVLDE